MHNNSMEAMKRFFNRIDGRFDRNKPLKILDVGSRVVDSQTKCYQDLMSDKWEYIGLDIKDGINVDVVSKYPYQYPFDDKSFDVIISGQTLEHIPFPWLWIKELYRLLKKGGNICIIAPSIWSEHDYPIDCWRILVKGMENLFGWAGFKSCWVYSSGNGNEIDCVGEAQK